MEHNHKGSRCARLVSNKFLKLGAVLTFVVFILIKLYASSESSGRLSEASTATSRRGVSGPSSPLGSTPGGVGRNESEIVKRGVVATMEYDPSQPLESVTLLVGEERFINANDAMLQGWREKLEKFSIPLKTGERRALQTPPLAKGSSWPPPALGWIHHPLPSRVLVESWGGEHYVLIFQDGTRYNMPESKPVCHLPYRVEASVDGQVIQFTARPRNEKP